MFPVDVVASVVSGDTGTRTSMSTWLLLYVKTFSSASECVEELSRNHQRTAFCRGTDCACVAAPGLLGRALLILGTCRLPISLLTLLAE